MEIRHTRRNATTEALVGERVRMASSHLFTASNYALSLVILRIPLKATAQYGNPVQSAGWMEALEWR